MRPRSTAVEPTQRNSSRRWVGFLRHPLVIGATLTLLSAVLASVLIPALTRVWQDRPKALALKRDLVAKISQTATAAIIRARYYPAGHPTASIATRDTAYTRTASRWQVDSAAIGSELATYFRTTALPMRWQRYTEAVRGYLHSQIDYLASSAWISMPCASISSMSALAGFGRNDRSQNKLSEVKPR
jgi:hypothetical protein